ncbi:MAG: hypothetical protein ACK5MV_04615 [Aminipila sp.]
MKSTTIIIGIALFAVATVVVYMWGLRKSMKQEQTLREMLLTKGANKVLTYLKKNDTITRGQISKLIADIKVSEFHSKNGVMVQNKDEFTTTLIKFMLDKNLITKDKDKYRKSK